MADELRGGVPADAALRAGDGGEGVGEGGVFVRAWRRLRGEWWDRIMRMWGLSLLSCFFRFVYFVWFIVSPSIPFVHLDR